MHNRNKYFTPLLNGDKITIYTSDFAGTVAWWSGRAFCDGTFEV